MRSKLINILYVFFIYVFILHIPVYSELRKPSKDQMKDIEFVMGRGNNAYNAYKEASEKEKEYRDKNNKELADKWMKRKDEMNIICIVHRLLAVTLVDLYYNIDDPPGVTFRYSHEGPQKGMGAYTVGEKGKITIIVCAPAFEHDPDFLASVKIHEMKHAWQIHNGIITGEIYWKDCTEENHKIEEEAYTEMEKEYDSGITGDMPEEKKELIEKKIKKHKDAGQRNSSVFGIWKYLHYLALAGEIVQFPFILYNGTASIVECTYSVSDEQGWMISPSSGCIQLQPEEKRTINIGITTGSRIGANPISINVQASGLPNPVSFSSTGFIIVTPWVKVTAGEPAGGCREETKFLQFTVRNIGAITDTFSVQFSNPLGWTSTQISDISLGPDEDIIITTGVTIPENAPAWSINPIYCIVTSTSDPLHTVETWAPLHVREYDATSLVIEEPLNSLELNYRSYPRVWIQNTGHITADLDVVFEVWRADNSLFFSDITHVTGLDPSISESVTFKEVYFNEPGLFTLHAYTLLTGDAEPDNDHITESTKVLSGTPTPTTFPSATPSPTSTATPTPAPVP